MGVPKDYGLVAPALQARAVVSILTCSHMPRKCWVSRSSDLDALYGNP